MMKKMLFIILLSISLPSIAEVKSILPAGDDGPEQCQTLRGFISFTQNVYNFAYTGRYSLQAADEKVSAYAMESIARDGAYSLSSMASYQDLIAMARQIRTQIFDGTLPTSKWRDQQIIIQNRCIEMVRSDPMIDNSSYSRAIDYRQLRNR
ncbi:hypothetical protein [Eikenella sp. NML99-0057]|uniref:hypothetical protein n=1 Tax=Eikenella sp. NML99-0057 TaxID=1795834 RepID=UPI0012E8A680|nr:hypothetical protein [Eikenella sp. NML99-0057]